VFKSIKQWLLNLIGTDTTTTTLAECIPTIVASALLELDEGDVVRPLVTNINFSGPGVIHQTPFITRLTSEADDSHTAQALDSTTSDETSPSAATVGVHGSTVQLKDIANLGSVDDMAAVAGKLIGQSVTVRRDLDLCTLFSSFTANAGGQNTDPTPGALYTAYGTLRQYHAPLPYHLVLHPLQVYRATGLISLFDNSSDALSGAGNPGSVAEDFTRYGFAGMVMGFTLWLDANIAITSNNASGAAFSQGGIKFISKRGFQIEVDRDIDEVATTITGTEIWGEAILRNKHGVEMQFDTKESS
jgi:hypothetical protein